MLPVLLCDAWQNYELPTSFPEMIDDAGRDVILITFEEYQTVKASAQSADRSYLESLAVVSTRKSNAISANQSYQEALRIASKKKSEASSAEMAYMEAIQQASNKKSAQIKARYELHFVKNKLKRLERCGSATSEKALPPIP